MTTSTHITTSGGLISAAFIENIREPGSRQRGVEPESFALPWAEAPKSPAALEEAIAAAWELLIERWDAIRADLPAMDVSQVRARWLLPLFQVLDFDPVYLRGDTILDEEGKLRYPLSHRGWSGEGAPVLHTVAPSQDLDARMAIGRGLKARSPHDMLQAFLNVSPADRWAVLSNGILLRLLRDYHHTFTKGYVQFDLESIFETRNYGDFRALYRLCHASRFIPPLTSPPQVGGTEGGLAPLEQFYKDSIATGIKVGEDLRGQVRQAIETLGNGFLDGELIRRLQADAALCRAYYAEILHIIYRILFLLFAEQRGMMPGRDSLYAEAYSIAALRARAEGDIPGEDDFTDLWEGLKVTFRMVREGVPELGIFGYDGMLFDDDRTPLLAGRAVRNSDLLRAIRALTLIEREGVLQRISYADLGVEELGSIYESLLDFTPRVSTAPENVNGRQIPATTFFLDPRGSERKTTGSYYTHPSLVNELIKSALLPVARERLAAAGLPVIEEKAIGEATAGLLSDYAGLTAAQRQAGEAAILSIKVCDPAAGSGHFLVKANNALGAELARLRSGDEYPGEAQVQAAKRDVLAHCIYAVDVNPMAVELCKVSLWINASVRDKPLSFLDHHIKCGNSLIGATPALMAEGLPTEAFDGSITGNDRATANAIRKRNREEQAGQLPLGWRVTVIETPEDLERWRRLSQLAEEQPRLAREQYAEYITEAHYRRQKLEADFWTAAFFWPLVKPPAGSDPAGGWFPTHGEFMRLQDEGPEALPPEALAQIEALAEQYCFFHWHLEFPDVFQPPEGSKPSGGSSAGFDVVLGNPPWERIKLQEKEFFADKDAAIANARTAAARRKLIARLPQTNPALHAAYTAALRASEATGHFLRTAGRFPLTSGGDINTYAVFAELARDLLAPDGRAGLVVPTGIATDYTYRDFFADLVESGQLASLYDFENREGLFPGTHRSYKFALLTLTGGGTPEAEYAFFLHTADELSDPERRFGLSREDLALINPNTRTVPVFRTRRDAELTRKLYRAAPVLVNEATGENPWGVHFLAMFHMTNDSHLFRTREQLEAEGFMLEGNRFVRGEEVYLPLYEAKMFWHFDHRFGTYAGVEGRSDVHLPTPTQEQYSDPAFIVHSWYWVEQSEVIARLKPDPGWVLAFRDISNTTNERTGVFTLLPWSAMSNKAPLLLLGQRRLLAAALVANLNSLPFDFAVRQKMGGTSLNFFIVKQLPVLPPTRYTPDLLDFIVPRVVELTYTAWDLQPFAADVLAEVGAETWARWFKDAPVHTSPPPAWAAGAHPPPFVWDEERRAVLRAELDALYAHLYGLTQEELAYILDTFPIVRRKDEERWGEYRTKRMVLEKFGALGSLKH
ncbi:MAG: hypothetical protein H5T62_12480 [Anaerolineae bacterium]|nr:hypothetical protein [Anaerolineae bacterium]